MTNWFYKLSSENSISIALHSALPSSYIQHLHYIVVCWFHVSLQHDPPCNWLVNWGLWGLSTSLCNWRVDFPTNKPQAAWIFCDTRRTLLANIASPPGVQIKTVSSSEWCSLDKLLLEVSNTKKEGGCWFVDEHMERKILQEGRDTGSSPDCSLARVTEVPATVPPYQPFSSGCNT